MLRNIMKLRNYEFGDGETLYVVSAGYSSTYYPPVSIECDASAGGGEACPDGRYSGKGRSSMEAPIEAQIGGLITMNKLSSRTPVREWIGEKK